MTPEELENIERALAKSRAGDGPQRLADWAAAHGGALIAALREAVSADRPDALAPLRPLYPGMDGDLRLVVAARDDIAAMRAERAKQADKLAAAADIHVEAFGQGKAFLSEFARSGEAWPELAARIRRVMQAMAPLAALGAPPCIAQMEESAAAMGGELVKSDPWLSIVDGAGEPLAEVSLEHFEAAWAALNAPEKEGA